ncbi:MAG: hypothetical protein NXI13_00855 [Proteobacteria bacterium]|nr:hypothetical protein [Pseudomonadota bacterium]
MKQDLKRDAVKNLLPTGKDQKTSLFTVQQNQMSERNTRSFYLRLPFLLIVVLPVIFGIVYFGSIVTNRYVSYSQLSIRTAESGPTSLLGGLVGAVSGTNAMSSEAYIVRDFILSRSMVTKLQEMLDIRSIFAAKDADYFSRFHIDGTDEELYDYFLNRVSVFFDPETQIIELSVEAFSPDDALAIALSIVALCDDLVDNISLTAREDSLAFARKEVERAERRVEDARLAISAFRQKHGEIDPISGATSIGTIVASIELELSKAQTEISQLRSYLREDSAQIVAAKARLSALQQQLKQERARLAGEASEASEGNYVPLLADYERLVIEDEFAKAAYTAAGTSMELARAEAARKHIYLVAFVEPSRPDESTKPDRPKLILTILLCSVIAFGLFTLILAAIREHARL